MFEEMKEPTGTRLWRLIKSVGDNRAMSGEEYNSIGTREAEEKIQRAIARLCKSRLPSPLEIIGSDCQPTAVGKRGHHVSRKNKASKTQRYVCSTYRIIVGTAWLEDNLDIFRTDFLKQLVIDICCEYHKQMLGVEP